MRSLLLFVVSILIVVAQSLLENQDSTEAIDSSGTGIKTTNLDSSDPVFNPVTLNLKADNSENPKLYSNGADYNNDPGSSSDTPTLLAYNADIFHDSGKSASILEIDSDNPSLNSNAPASASLDSNPIAMPDFNPLNHVQLGDLAFAAPVDKTLDMHSASDSESMPDGNGLLSGLSGGCTLHSGATGLEERDGSICRVVVSEDLLKEDWVWLQRRYRENKRPVVAQDIMDKCNRLGQMFSKPRLLPMCCFGPDHIWGREILNGHTYYISDEENCNFNFIARPICRNERDKFCCGKVGDRMGVQVHGQTSLFWGEDCIPMSGLPENL